MMTANRWGYQGQEREDGGEYGERTHYAYRYRIHNAALGRFISVDPLVRDYPWNSPYAFSENRLLDAVELEGLEARTIV